MKTFSPIKFFTPVCFVLVMGLGSAGLGATNCKYVPDVSLNTRCENKFSGDANKIKECDSYIECLKNEKEEKDQARQDKREKKAECDKAYDKFTSKYKDYLAACRSMNASSDKQCSDRIKSCASLGGGAGPKSTTAQQFTNLMMSAYMQKNNLSLPNDPEAKDANSLNSCTDFTNDKTERARDKLEQKQDKLKQKIADLKDKIYKEQEDRDKENARLSKETNDIEVDKQKIDKELKEALRDVEKQKNINTKELSEGVAKNATAIQKLNQEIIRLKETSESIKFDYGQKVVQFSEDKVSKQCKAAVETAKACFVKSSKGQKSTDPKDTCSNFSLTAKGAKGTAELKQKLKDIQEACFEQAKLSTDKARFEHQKSLRSVETSITAKSQEIKDAQDGLQRTQENFKKISEESENKRNDEMQNASKQLENFTNKLAGITQDVQTNITRRELRMRQLEQQISDVEKEVMAAKLGITSSGESFQSTYKEAEGAISEGEEALNDAKEICCNDPNSAQCKRLKTSADKIKKSGRSTKEDSGGEQ